MNPADLSRLLPRLRAMALYALGDASLAQDIAQEAIARALARGDELQDSTKTTAFVAGIARHIITDHIRAKRRVEVDIEAVEIAEAHPDALAQLMADEERLQLFEALQQLAPADREILRLSYEEGLGPAEIAERLAETSIVVRKRKSRAIERLRTVFQQIADAKLRHKPMHQPTDMREATVTHYGGGSVATDL